MLISWIMIWLSAVMMDCSFSSSIWGILAFSPWINGNVWISCWCETTFMVYQSQYHLMSRSGPCHENLLTRFILYVEPSTLDSEQRASAPAKTASARLLAL